MRDSDVLILTFSQVSIWSENEQINSKNQLISGGNQRNQQRYIFDMTKNRHDS